MEINGKHEQVYTQMVNNFKAKKDKKALIKIMKDYCQLETTTPQNIYDLKKKLEINFSTDVNCTYCYTLSTPIDYGCDLREIFYDRNNTLIEGGQELLDIFYQKKLPDIWHIMTDIDDTLYPNTEHGTYIAGSDNSWYQKTPYPGIITFYNSFYKKLPNNSKYTTILSATPGCLKHSKLQDKKGLLHSILKVYGFIQGPESKIQVSSYSGDIITNCVSQYCGSQNTSSDVNSIPELFKLFGNTKFERFKQYISIFPEYRILFFGDNGQGDVLAGKQMVEFNDRCNVFIHKVSEDGKTFKSVIEESQGIDRLNFFKNYYEASLKLQELGILNQEDVNNIKNAVETRTALRANSNKPQSTVENNEDKKYLFSPGLGGRKTKKNKKKYFSKTKKNRKTNNKKKNNKKTNNKKTNNKKSKNKKTNNKKIV
jgi:hypothetical protein